MKNRRFFIKQLFICLFFYPFLKPQNSFPIPIPILIIECFYPRSMSLESFLKFRSYWQDTSKIKQTNSLFIKNKEILNIMNDFSDNKYATIITFDSKSSMKKWESKLSSLAVFNVKKLKNLGFKFKKTYLVAPKKGHKYRA